ncbi:MAG: ClpXP protease specificity-enhancing factor [Pseudomonadota bacterium]
MSSTVPYLVRAIFDWIVDNECTPHLVVDAEIDNTDVPLDYVKDGQIVLNIGPMAVVDLTLGDDGIFFRGRFGGVSHDVHVPMNAVLGIIARENGEGMWFPREEHPDTPDDEPPGGEPGNKKGNDGPKLKVVK